MEDSVTVASKSRKSKSGSTKKKNELPQTSSPRSSVSGSKGRKPSFDGNSRRGSSKSMSRATILDQTEPTLNPILSDESFKSTLKSMISEIVISSVGPLVSEAAQLAENISKLNERVNKLEKLDSQSLSSNIFTLNMRVKDLEEKQNKNTDVETDEGDTQSNTDRYLDAMDQVLLKEVNLELGRRRATAMNSTPPPGDGSRSRTDKDTTTKNKEQTTTIRGRSLERVRSFGSLLKRSNSKSELRNSPRVLNQDRIGTSMDSPKVNTASVSTSFPRESNPASSTTSTEIVTSQPPLSGASTHTRGSTSSKKRVSLRAMHGFMKVMRKGVLPKVLAGQLGEAVRKVEPNLTALLTEIAKESDGELVGLEYKFKTSESLTAKIDRDVHHANLKVLEDMERRRKEAGSLVAKAQATGEKRQKKLRRASAAKTQEHENSSTKEQAANLLASRVQADRAARHAAEKMKAAAVEIEERAEKEGANEVDITAIVWEVSDALRYTVLIKTEKYTQAVNNAVERLKKEGMTPASLKNYWGPGDGYQGINDVFLVPCELSPNSKVKVEIQFHTPESFEHKMAVHGMYEEFRTTRDPSRKVELWDRSVSMADAIPVPKDVLLIPHLKTQPMPIETTLYVELVLSRALKIQQAAVDAVTKAFENLDIPSYMVAQTSGSGREAAEVTIGESGRKTNAKITSHLSSPSSIEMRIDSEMLIAEKKLLRGGSISELRASMMNATPSETEFKLKDAALRITDALVVSVVLDYEVYTAAVELGLGALFTKFQSTSSDKSPSVHVKQVSETKTTNGWSSPMVLKRTGPTGGVGIYCYATMEGEDDGVEFTPDDAYPLIIEFHTPESLTARIGLQSAWSEYRNANTSKQRKTAMLKAQRLSAQVEVPLGATSVRGPKWLKKFEENKDLDEEEDSDYSSDENY